MICDNFNSRALMFAGLFAAFAAFFGIISSSSSVSKYSSELSARDEAKYGTLVAKLDSPLVVGDNICYMAIGYMEESKMQLLLPASLTLIPLNAREEMFGLKSKRTQQDDHMYPILLSFCHGKDIHDIFSEVNVPEQEEIMIVIPALYKNKSSGNTHVCSFLPVLYLDSILGVLGGVVSYGMRKQYHPSSGIGGWFEVAEEKNDNKMWHIKNVIHSNFTHQPSSKQMAQLPKFFSAVFRLPFITVSYFGKYFSYHAEIQTKTIHKAVAKDLSWIYKGAAVTTAINSVYVEYTFAMSDALNAEEVLK
mmetsp:Transcript_24356/g.41684  ORF Transcript_24356/g.41684 Transcript_24356/m.41684 type:complete len:306 (+) Transcript_24356:163-1080(+)